MPRLTPDWALAEELIAEWGEAAPAEAAWWAARHHADGLLPAARQWREVEAICIVLIRLRQIGDRDAEEPAHQPLRRIASR